MHKISQQSLITLILAYLIFSQNNRLDAAELYLNFFRNPSIGPEVKFENFSIHTGYYTTILSKNEKGENVSTEFIRTGITLWPSENLYLSASHLFGVTREWKDQHGGIYELGLQALVLSDRLALRLGVAVIPSERFGTKVNPTPGISLRLPL